MKRPCFNPNQGFKGAPILYQIGHWQPSPDTSASRAAAQLPATFKKASFSLLVSIKRRCFAGGLRV
jgi:hypothetical protein